MQQRYRIGAIHALMNAIPTTQLAFDRGWPGADVAHLLDGSLYLDRSLGTADDAELASRIDRLVRYSAATGADGIIMTGSFFGDAVKQARVGMEHPGGHVLRRHRRARVRDRAPPAHPVHRPRLGDAAGGRAGAGGERTGAGSCRSPARRSTARWTR